MKKILLLVFVLQCLAGAAQRRSTNFVMTDDGPFYIDRDLSATAAKYVNETSRGLKVKANIEGSAFLHEQWHKGFVKLENNRVANNQDIKYNVYNNKVYFLKDSQELVLTTPIKEFGYTFTSPAGPQPVLFRNGYKKIGSNNESTFYEVLVDQQLTLLKQYVKKVAQVTSPAGAPTYRVIDSDVFYVYDGKKNFIYKIKPDLNFIMDALRPQADRISQIVQEKQLDVKSQAGLTALFQALGN